MDCGHGARTDCTNPAISSNLSRKGSFQLSGPLRPGNADPGLEWWCSSSTRNNLFPWSAAKPCGMCHGEGVRLENPEALADLQKVKLNSTALNTEQ